MFHMGEVELLTNLGLESQYQDVLDRIEQLDPNSSTLALAESLISVRQGNLDAALEAANAWVRSFPPENTSRHYWKATVHMFRGETAMAAAEIEMAWGGPPKLDGMLGMARDAPDNACMWAWMIHEEVDAGMAVEMIRVALEQADRNLLDHQRRQLNLGMSACHLVLGEREAALARIEQAVEDGQLNRWHFTLSYPLFKALELEPRYQVAWQRIEEAMAGQRERFLLLSKEEGL